MSSNDENKNIAGVSKCNNQIFSNDVLSLIFEYITFLVDKQEKKLMDEINFPFVRYSKNFNYQCKMNVIDEELEYLKGIHNISLSSCKQFTDKGLEHLKGVII